MYLAIHLPCRRDPPRPIRPVGPVFPACPNRRPLSSHPPPPRDAAEPGWAPVQRLTDDPSQPAVLACPALELKALWSRSRKSADEAARLIPDGAAPSVDLYSSDAVDGAQSYDNILKRSDIQGLILALPIPDQPAYIRKALAAGKHVLAEKPIGPDVASAQELIAYYRRVAAETQATLAIAENFRFTAGWNYGREEVKKLGRVTGFAVRVNWNMTLDNKYLNTSWRAKPQYQGGMLLDAGVHFTAALRRLLGQEHAVESLIAQTSLVQSYLPPVDSVNAVMKTKTGAVGSFNLSTGTTLQAFEFHIACEGGQVQAEGAKVVTIRGSGESAQKEEKVFDKSSGVKEEVKAVSLPYHNPPPPARVSRRSLR